MTYRWTAPVAGTYVIETSNVSSGGGGAPDFTYAWTAPAAGLHAISVSGNYNFDRVLSVRSACNGAQLACIYATWGDLGQATVWFAEGQEVVIVVDGDYTSGAYTLGIAAVATPTPTLTETATLTLTPTLTATATATPTPTVPCPQTDLGSTVPAVVTGSTAGGVNLFGLASCADGGVSAPDASYRWTAPADGMYAIDTGGSAFDTILAVREATCSGIELACNDDAPDLGVQSRLTLSLSAGQAIVIVVDGFGAQAGTYTLAIERLPLATPTPSPTEPPPPRPTAPSPTPRAITIEAPADGSSLNTSPVAVTGSFASADTVVVNGVSAMLTGNTFTAAVPLLEGLNTITATATTGTDSASDTIHLTLDTSAPAAPNLTLITTGLRAGAAVTVIGSAGSVEANGLVTITDTRTAETVVVSADDSGAFRASVAAQAGDTLSLFVTDRAGNAGPPADKQVGTLVVTITDTILSAASDGYEVTVRGTLASLPSATVGITVNGMPGLVEAEQFVARVTVDTSVTALIVTVRDFSGILSAVAVPITVPAAPPPPAIVLRAASPARLTPLTTSFTYSSPIPIAHVALDANGDGTPDADETTFDTFSFTYTHPGLYLPRLTVTAADGNVYTTVAIVHVADPVVMDARLQPVWQGVKDALRVGDVSAATQYVHSDTRDTYGAAWSQVPLSTLENIDQIMTQVQLVDMGPAGAEYEMRRDRDGQTLSYPVWFQLDADGLWRLRRF